MLHGRRFQSILTLHVCALWTLESDKGISSTLIGLLLSLWAFTSVIAQPIMGMLNDRLNDCRQILMLCTILSPILAFDFYFFDAYFALLIFSVLFQWFQSSSASLSDALAVEIGRRSRSIS